MSDYTAEYEPHDEEAWARKHGLTEEELVSMTRSLSISAERAAECNAILDELFPEDKRRVRGINEQQRWKSKPREVEDHGRNPT